MNIDMQTDDIIDKLSDNLAPTKSLASPLLRAIVLLSFGVLYVSAMIYFIYGLRGDILERLQNFDYQFELLVVAILSLLGTFASMKLAVPSDRKKLFIYPIVLINLLIVLGLLVLINPLNIAILDSKMLLLGSHCLADIAILSLPMVALSFWLIKKSAPNSPALSGGVAILSAVAIGYIGIRITCSFDELYHQSLYHFLPIVLYSLVGVFLGNKYLRW